MNEPLLKKDGPSRRPEIPSLAPYINTPKSEILTSKRKKKVKLLRDRQNRLRHLLTQYVHFAQRKKCCPFITNLAIGLFILGHLALSYFATIVPCLGQPSTFDCMKGQNTNWVFLPWLFVISYFLIFSLLACITQTLESIRKRELPAWHRDTFGWCVGTFFTSFFLLIFLILEVSNFSIQAEGTTVVIESYSGVAFLIMLFVGQSFRIVFCKVSFNYLMATISNLILIICFSLLDDIDSRNKAVSVLLFMCMSLFGIAGAAGIIWTIKMLKPTLFSANIEGALYHTHNPLNYNLTRLQAFLLSSFALFSIITSFLCMLVISEATSVKDVELLIFTFAWLALLGASERIGYILFNTLTQQVEMDFYLSTASLYYIGQKQMRSLSSRSSSQENTDRSSSTYQSIAGAQFRVDLLATARKNPKTSTSTVSEIEMKINGVKQRDTLYSGDGGSTQATSMQRCSINQSRTSASPSLRY